MTPAPFLPPLPLPPLHALHLPNATQGPTESRPPSALAPTPAPQSLDPFMILFISVFLFLTATILRVIPWATPLHPRSRWASRSPLSFSTESEALRVFTPFAYGTLEPSMDSASGLSPSRASSPPTYETLLEIGESIGNAKIGFSDEQIAILPSYVCSLHDKSQTWQDASCAICRDDFHHGDHVRLLPCSDYFHLDCIGPWLRQQATCPLCRCRFA